MAKIMRNPSSELTTTTIVVVGRSTKMLYALQRARLGRPALLGDTAFPPCTPYSVIKLLKHDGISVEGQNVVVVGASNIVGKPT
jgi:5,10-methylene-tetrahydrofolate dehydrogenase/methenyl tetrahydrofolate cyclohydrolase